MTTITLNRAQGTISRRFFPLCLAVLALIALGATFGAVLPGSGIDWHLTYRPAARAVLAGDSPFTVDIFYAAPWAVLPLLPLAILPETAGRAALFAMGLSCYALAAVRLGAKRLALIAFLLSPPVLHGLFNGNVEWMPLLGATLPPQIGLFFLAVKPQIGLGVAIFWLWREWKSGGARRVLRTFGPASFALAASFVAFGLWPLRFGETLGLTASYNQSIFPYGVPVGLALLVISLARKDHRPALAASPFLSPYTLLHAWVGAVAATVRNPKWTIAVSAGIWILGLWGAYR